MHFSKIAPVVALAAGVSASYVPEVEPYVSTSTYDIHAYESTPVHYPEYPEETPAYPHESPIHYPESSSTEHYPEPSPIHYPESSSAVHYPEASPIHYPETSPVVHYPEESPAHYPEESPEHYPSVTASPYPEHDGYSWEYYHTKYTTSEVCSYETTTTDKYEVYCPEPTTYVHDKHTYVVDKPKTLTITDGPYTVTHPVYTAVVVDCTTSTKVPKPTYHATKDGKASLSTKDGEDSYPTKDGEVSYPTKDGQAYPAKPEATKAPVKSYPSANATAVSPVPYETGSVNSPVQEEFYGAASRTTFSAAGLAVVFGLFAYIL